MRAPLVRGFLLSLLCFAAAAGAQNAVLNPDFDTNTDSWNPTDPLQAPGGVFVRDADSGVGLPAGAADLQYSRPPGAGSGELSIITNCMTVAGNTPLDFGGFVRHQVNPGPGSVTLALLTYTSTDCMFGLSFFPATPAGSSFPGKVDGSPVSFTLLTGAATTPVGTQRMQMLAAVNPGGENLANRALFDHIFVGPPGGLVPLFFDGFETDSTASWSTSVP
jgi:hypothetical protein